VLGKFPYIATIVVGEDVEYKMHTSDRVSGNAVRRKIIKCVWEAQNTLRRGKARTFQLELEGSTVQ